MPILQIAGEIAGKMLNAFFMNYFFMFLYVLIILFIRFQHQKYSELQEDVYGQNVINLRKITEKVILTGLLTGFAASFLLVAAGITIETEGVRCLFYIMCILLLINIRFACISYAAGSLSIISLIFGYPEINISSLLALAAILQMVESLLIYINRKDDYIPVFMRRDGEIAGAFIIRRFWMVPVVFFTYVLQTGNAGSGISALPYALFNSRGIKGVAYVLGFECLAAVLCHFDTAITKHPERKSTEKAGMLFAYSVVLFAIAVFSVRNPAFEIVGAVFCVVAHEGIHVLSEYLENVGEPLYSAARRGLRILDILPGSNAERMGLMRGDIILSINNKDIQTYEGVVEALREYPTFTWIQVAGWDGNERTVEYRCFPGGYNTLGIIPVPREKEVTYNMSHFEYMSILRNIVNKFRRQKV